MVAVVASLIGDVVHGSGTIQPSEGVAITVTLAAGILAIWAFVEITLRRRSGARTSWPPG